MEWVKLTLLLMGTLLMLCESKDIFVCKNINIDQATEEVATCTGAVLQGIPGDKGVPGEPPIISGLPIDLMNISEDVGEQRFKGEMGMKGVKGDKGLNGLKGDAGRPGPPGRQGEQGIIGPIGKRGMVGVMGPPGPPGRIAKEATGPPGVNGPPGLVNYTAIETYIEQRLQERSCLGGLVYNNTCIRLPYTTGRVVTYETGEKLCRRYNGEVVEVFNAKMLDVIIDYVNMTWVENVDHPAINHVTVWLRSTFEVSGNDENLITLSSGRRISLERWRSNTPYKDTVNARQLKLYVATIGSRDGTGIYNVDGGSAIPLCVRPL